MDQTIFSTGHEVPNMNVLFLNIYSIKTVLKYLNTGNGHSAHLWGYDYFSQHAHVQYVNINKKINKLVQKIQLNKLIGDIYQELQVVPKRKKIDLIITGNINNIWGLGYLRRFMRFPPIIAILHSMPQRNSWFYRTFMRTHCNGIDKIVCITKKDYHYLQYILKLPLEKIHYIQWAANIDDYDKIISSCRGDFRNKRKYIVSIGWSKRDYNTLINAFLGTNIQDLDLRIFCNGINIDYYKNKQLKVISEWVDFKYCVREYRDAEFVVVPLEKSNRTLGLTSLYDAMAMGKAVIITKNSGIDIDVEKEKVGLWVNPNDIEDMKRKILFFAENPLVAKQYGYNGREYLKKKHNYTMFCKELYKVAKSTVNSNN